MRQPVQFGVRYRDWISGFEGVATARTEYMNGCVRVVLEGGIGTDGKPIEEWFDEQRLVDAHSGQRVEVSASAGGPGPTPPKLPHPS